MTWKSRWRMGASWLPVVTFALITSTVAVASAAPLDGLAVLGPAKAVATAQRGGKVRACAPGVSSLPANFTHLRTPPAETPRAVALGVCEVMVVPEAEADQASAQLRGLGVDVAGVDMAGEGGPTPTGSSAPLAGTSFLPANGAGALPGFVPGGSRGPAQQTYQPQPIRQMAAASPVAPSGPRELPAPPGLDPTDSSAPAADRTDGPAGAPRLLPAPRGADAPEGTEPQRPASRSTVPRPSETRSAGPRTLPAPRGLDANRSLDTPARGGTPASGGGALTRVDQAQADFHDGYEALQRNRLEQAAALFERGLQSSPYNWLALFYLAQAYDRMGRVEEAVPVYDQVIELAPRSQEATFARDRMRREGYTPRRESGSAARLIDEPAEPRRAPTRRLNFEPQEPPDRSVREIFETSEGASYHREFLERSQREKELPPLPQPINRARAIAAEREGLNWSLRRDRLASLDDDGRLGVGTRLYSERPVPRPEQEPERETEAQPQSRPQARPQPERTRLRLQAAGEAADSSGRVSTRLGAERPVVIVRTEEGPDRPAVDEPAPAPAAEPASPPSSSRIADMPIRGEPLPPPGPVALLPVSPAAPLAAPQASPSPAASAAPVEAVPLAAPNPVPAPNPDPAPVASAPPTAAATQASAPASAAPGSPFQTMTLAFPDGSRFVGETSNGKPEGMGTLTYADGTRYTGGFVSGKRGGRGTLLLANGWRYEGDFVEDQPNGRGVLTQPDGTVYDGEFQAGRRTGSGTIRLPNGERYVGMVADGVPQGRGVYEWPDGHRYEGEFRDGSIDGTGVMSYPGGNKVSGLWRNQELVRPL